MTFHSAGWFRLLLLPSGSLGRVLPSHYLRHFVFTEPVSWLVSVFLPSLFLGCVIAESVSWLYFC